MNVNSICLGKKMEYKILFVMSMFVAMALPTHHHIYPQSLKHIGNRRRKIVGVIMMLWCGSLNPIIVQGPVRRSRLCSRAQGDGVVTANKKKKVVVVGSGWAGLGAAHHLCNQGFDVTVLDDGPGPHDVGIQGFWYPNRNIFSLVDQLGLKPFTTWTRSAQYFGEDLQVEFPVFQELPQLPTPLGTLYYSQFSRLSLADKISSLPLMAAVIDFDNTDAAWRKYDSVTARELFKQFGCSESLYENILRPLLQVGLFAPPEQCSAAATLALFYYLIFSHQKDFDMVWCRGTVREMIFNPWTDSLKERGCRFLRDKPVTDFILSDDDYGDVTQVVCGRDKYKADAVILAARISTLQETIKKSASLCKREEFLRVLNLRSVDVVSVKLKLDRKVAIRHASNACSVLEDSYRWTFFDLNSIYDAYKEEEETVLRADFYNASELMGTTDEMIVEKAILCYISKCVKDLKKAVVKEADVERFAQSLPRTFLARVIQADDARHNVYPEHDGGRGMGHKPTWVMVTGESVRAGLEAANGVVDYVGEGSLARIIPIQEEEPHVEALRSLNRTMNQLLLLLSASLVNLVIKSTCSPDLIMLNHMKMM